MTSHDITMLTLALDTAILEAEKAVAETPVRALEYKGYCFALSEFNRLKAKLEKP